MDDVASPSWVKRFPQQFSALLKKNALVAWRNRRATILRILAPLFFLLLVLLIDKAVQANNRDLAKYKVVRDPSATAVTAIPACENDLYAQEGKPCWDFLYTPDNDTVIDGIVSAIRQNNPGRPIPASKVQAFKTRDDADVWMSQNQQQTTAAVHFQRLSDTDIRFALQTNFSTKFFKGEFQDPNTFVQLPMQVAVHREITRHFMRQKGIVDADSLQYDVAFKEFAHPATDNLSIVGTALPIFIFAANMFTFVVVINAVVQEREAKLKQALRTMGMYDSSYWLSWMAWEFMFAAVIGLLTTLFGLMFQFDLFKKNDFGILFFTFFLFQLSMVSLAFFLAAFVAQAQVATYIGFAIFLIGWIFQLIVTFGVPYTTKYYKDYGGILTIIFSLMPWNGLAKILHDLGDASANADSAGIEWSQRYSYCVKEKFPPNYVPDPDVYKTDECVLPIGQWLGIFVVLWLGYFFLGWYLDLVLPDENGVRKSPFYLFLPSYWFPDSGRSSNRVVKRPQQLERTSSLREDGTIDEDVAMERQRLEELLSHRTGQSGAASEAIGQNAVEVFGLQKRFEGRAKRCACCGPLCGCCGYTDAFWAIKDSWFAIEKNQLFCLLGPNGAGKTTTINCLTGVLPPSGGDALVYGESLQSAGGLDRIRSMMGVCPQFDILWGELSGIEHLLLYAHVKGLHPKEAHAQAAELLHKVKLTSAGKMRTGSYSGGMKRRLSVAIALLGNPRIVYLDEPTTGMDPISRRHVWDVIEECKKGRAIVLTTHSMEEADILGDRIAIMAKGRLRCIGSSIRLKQRFGAGYQVSISVLGATKSTVDLQQLALRAQRVREFVQSRINIAPADETKAYIQYLIPRTLESQLPAFLAELEDNKDTLAISDIQISLTSLEEVFLNIARKAEMEENRNKVVDVALPDGNVLRVPIGVELFSDPATSIAWQVKWGQDESGNLVVLSAVPAGMMGGAAASNGAAPVLAPPNGSMPHATPVTAFGENGSA